MAINWTPTGVAGTPQLGTYGWTEGGAGEGAWSIYGGQDIGSDIPFSADDFVHGASYNIQGPAGYGLEGWGTQQQNFQVPGYGSFNWVGGTGYSDDWLYPNSSGQWQYWADDPQTQYGPDVEQPYGGPPEQGESTPWTEALGERMDIMREGTGGPAGQTSPWREAMKGGVRSAFASRDIGSTREDLAREAYGQLEQAGQLGQFAQSPWMSEFQGAGGQGGPPIAPTAWGTYEAPNQRLIQQMQQEASRISGQGGFEGEGGAAGLAEFYEQFPWMKGPDYENQNMYFNQLVNPDMVPLAGEIPMIPGEALPDPERLF